MRSDTGGADAARDECARRGALRVSRPAERALNFGVDVEGRVTHWNAEAAALTGFAAEEALGRHFVRGFAREAHRASIEGALEMAVRGQDAVNYRLPLVTKAGVECQILLNITTRHIASGQVVGIVCTGHDITGLSGVISENPRTAREAVRLIETADAPIFSVNCRGVVTGWNKKVATITGYLEEEMLGMHLVERFITMDFRASLDKVFKAALNGSETTNFTLDVYTKQGVCKKLLLSATARRGSVGFVTGVICVGQDISNSMVTIAEHQPMASSPFRLIETASAQQTLVGNEMVNYSLPLMSNTRQLWFVLLGASARRDPWGQVTSAVGVGQEIVDFTKTTSESLQLADYLTRLIDMANAMIFGIDLEGKLTEWNEKMAATTGFTREEAIGQHFAEVFVTSEVRASVIEVLSTALKGQETTNFEFHLCSKDVVRKDILLSTTTRRGPQGEVTGVTAVGQDITKIRTMIAKHQRVAGDTSCFTEAGNAPERKGVVTARSDTKVDMPRGLPDKCLFG